MEFILFGFFLILLLLNIPIAVSLGLATIAALVFGDMPTPPLVVAQRMFTSVDSFPFMAIPFFMLAGGLMETGGISKRLIEFAKTLVGGLPGGLGIITVVASAFFAALSGSNPATVAAIGSIMIPAMIKAGYPKDFAAALTAAAGTLGVIIPPSIPMVTYGVVASVSIGSLFMAGVIPGIIIGAVLVGVVLWQAKRLQLTGGEKASALQVARAFKDAILALFMPVIILGGIYGGVFTPTEAAAVAVVYSLIVGMFIYREISLTDLPSIITKAATSTSVVLFVVATSASFSWLLTSLRIPEMVAEGMLSITSDAVIILLFINLILLFLGTFLETQAIILLVAPILLPLTINLGIDPILLGIIMVINTSIGMITPPMAVNLFVACSLANLSIEQISKRILPFLVAEIIALLLISNVPKLSLFLPNLLGK